MATPFHESRQERPLPGNVERAPLLVLASASPRRSQLLTQAGFAHRVVTPPLDDAALAPGARSPRRWVAGLAYLKADATRRSLEPGIAARAIILAADTVVVKDGRIIGQPTDADDARSILRALRAGSHEVVTGAALLAPGRPRTVLVDAARVRVGEITDSVIDAYIASDGWRGKAGAYNLEERLRAGWPIEYEGDPGTIMGLPMRRLASMLGALLGSDTALEARA